jgi:hypothetical protein
MRIAQKTNASERFKKAYTEMVTSIYQEAV